MREEWRGVALCADAEIAEGEARVVAVGRGWPPEEIIVLRHAGVLRGYVNVCPHQPLPLNVDRLRTADDELLCDHHPARFRFADGFCTAGPCAGASLVAVPVEVRDGTVRISAGG